MQGADFPSDRFLSSPAPLAAPDEPALEPHHAEVADAVAALDALEADIGAVSLSSPSLPSRPASPPLFPGNDEAEADHLGLHSLADCALVFLEALGEPVVCWSAYGRALECEDRDEAYRVVRELPEAVRLLRPPGSGAVSSLPYVLADERSENCSTPTRCCTSWPSSASCSTRRRTRRSVTQGGIGSVRPDLPFTHSCSDAT